MKIPPKPSVDELLAQAVCAIFVDNSKATGWLFSEEGHLLTVGHVFPPDAQGTDVEVQFLDDIPRKAHKLYSAYSQQTADDFAILQLEDSAPLANREPLPVAFVPSVKGQWRLQGYGKTLGQQSGGRGEFVGLAQVQNSSDDFFFKLDSKQAGESGFSGSPIFSEELQAVVAIQTEATIADLGAERDTVLAVPLYRIAGRWKKFRGLANELAARTDEEEDRHASPKKYLEYRIKKAYATLGDSATDSKTDESSSEILEAKYAEGIKLYLKIYFLLCERIHQSPNPEIIKIKPHFPEITIEETRQSLQSEAGPRIYTNLPGRRVTIGVSQMFRIADLLTRPESVRAREFYEAITNANKMRRSLRGRKKFKLGALGSLRPVTNKPNDYDSFWNPAIPDFSSPAVQPLAFIPYELSLMKQLQNSHLGTGDESTINRVTVSATIQNYQINGRLRIYPPGIGVISLSLALEFKDGVPIELVAQIAHNIEQVLFVGPGDAKPYDVIMLKIINRVIDNLFNDEGFDYSHRHWSPPVTTFSFPDSEGFVPEDRLSELAYLMSLAPANRGDLPYLEGRIRQALRTPRWKQEGILAVASEGVALFFVDDRGNKMLKRRRNSFRLWLTETHELISAAAYAQQAFAEEIGKLYIGLILDKLWLPQNGERFKYLKSLLETMQQVMRAINSIGGPNGHLRNQGAGALTTFARDVWTYSNPVDRAALENGIAYISDWVDKYAENPPGDVSSLRPVVDAIRRMSPPFSEAADRSQTKNANPQNQELETGILEMFTELEEMSKKYEPDELAESQYQRVMQDLRKELGLSGL
ncbi:MAG: serine protease [Acidobacteriota bacterium]|nr:serine protease [Acidobacteriota bacterium]